MLALTFDDGPDPRGTPAVLAALARASAHATFFVLGERADAHPDLVERTLAEGHAVEVHGHAHLRHPLSTRDAVAADLDAALAVLRRLGVEPRLWRIPWGDLAPWTEELADARGLVVAGWTLDSHDWRGHSAADMLATVEPRLAPGAIVLAHDGVGPGALREGCAETAALVGPLVATVRGRGLEPTALDTPLPAGNPDLCAGVVT